MTLRQDIVFVGSALLTLIVLVLFGWLLLQRHLYRILLLLSLGPLFLLAIYAINALRDALS